MLLGFVFIHVMYYYYLILKQSRLALVNMNWLLAHQ